MKLFDSDETIVALSFKWKRGSNRRCVKPVPEIRCTCVCTRKDGGSGGGGAEQTFSHLVTLPFFFFTRQRRDPRKYITLDVVSTPAIRRRAFIPSRSDALRLLLAREISRASQLEGNIPAFSGVRRYVTPGWGGGGGGAKVIYLAELARAFLHRSVRRKLDTREDIRATHTMTGGGASHSTVEHSRYRRIS